MDSLEYIINVGKGMLGRRNPRYPDPWERFAGKRTRVYGVGRMPAEGCPPTGLDSLLAVHYPCVSAPIAAISYRSACALGVHAGRVRTSTCGAADARPADGNTAEAADDDDADPADDLAHVGCAMRPGSHVVFRGLANGSQIASLLDREWLIGGGGPGSSFWIYREDYEPHGLAPSVGNISITPALIDAGSEQVFVRCALEPFLPPPGAPCCNQSFDNQSFSFPACRAARLPRWLPWLWWAAAGAATVLVPALVGLLARRRLLRMGWIASSPPLLSQQQYPQSQSSMSPSIAANAQAEPVLALQGYREGGANPREAGGGASGQFVVDTDHVHRTPHDVLDAVTLPQWDVMYVDIELTAIPAEAEPPTAHADAGGAVQRPGEPSPDVR